MIFGSVQKKDKLNRTVMLRSADAEDGEALLRYMKVVTEETPFLIRESNEVTLTLEQEKRFIQSRAEDPREVLLIAEIDGVHVGNCSVMSMGSYRRYTHRCEIAVALYQKYCDSGIGTILLETALDVAKEIGYEQAELEVISDNEPAIFLYEKLGFRKYGTFPNNMKYSNGTYADAYWMMKRL